MSVGAPSPGRPTLRVLIVATVVAGLVGAVCLGEDTAPREEADRPHFDARLHQAEYAGPGRDAPPPADVRDVAIGYFGPGDPDHPLGGDLWLASLLAVERANESGGYRGLPFRLVPAWSENPWGSGVADVARMVYADGVWGVVGSIDGSSTHLAEQVVAKARVTLISPASTDKTVNLANVAWAFSCLPADDEQARVLGRALAEHAGARSLTVVSATDHDSRVATADLMSVLAGSGVQPRRHVEFEPGVADADALGRQVADSGAEVVAIVAGPVESARLVASLARDDDPPAVFGGPSMGRRVFRELAGRAAEGVVFPLLCDPAFAGGDFADDFRSRFDRDPDCAAVQAYDATRMLLVAIERAGLNRARIRDAVQALSPWSGAAGLVEWNGLGQNRRTVRLATIRGGRVSPWPAGERTGTGLVH